MKRITALLCAALCMCLVLCSCDEMGSAVNSAKNKASEAVSDLNKDMNKYSTDNNGLFDDNRETVTPTNPPVTETEFYTEVEETEGFIEENVEEMIDNGQVEDGDGNVGDLENIDGDANVDENAVETESVDEMTD